MNRNRRLFALLQFAGSALLLWWVLRQVSLTELATQAASLHPARVILAFGIFVASYLLTVVVWAVALRAVSVDVGFRSILSAHLAGYFYGTVIPSSLSSDVGRGLRLGAGRTYLRGIALSIVLDRLSGLVVAGLVFVILTPAYLRRLPFGLAELAGPLPIWGGLLLALGIACAAAVMLFPATFREYLARAWALRRIWRAFSLMVALSFVVHLLVAVMLWVLLVPFWESASLWYCLYITELSQVAEVLPISVAGLGVREGLYVLALEPFGVARTDAVTVALVQFGLFVLWALVGGAAEAVRGVRGLRTAPPNLPERES